MKLTQKSRLTFLLAGILTTGFAMSACGKKSAKKVENLFPVNNAGATNIEIGKEFEASGPLTKSSDGGYGMEKSFNLEVTEVSSISLESAILSSCENDGEATSMFLMENSDGTFKISSKEFEGYTYVAEGQFPGNIAAGKYVFTVLFIADMPCEIMSASFKLNGSSTQLKDPAAVPADTTGPTGPTGPADTTGPTGPADTTTNSLVGTWKNEEVGVYSALMQLDSSGTGNEKFVYEGAQLYDLDYSYTFDTTKSPMQLVLTVTKINFKDSGVEVSVGDKNYCIYEVLSSSSLKMECDEVMPSAFSTDAQEFQRQ